MDGEKWVLGTPNPTAAGFGRTLTDALESSLQPFPPFLLSLSPPSSVGLEFVHTPNIASLGDCQSCVTGICGHSCTSFVQCSFPKTHTYPSIGSTFLLFKIFIRREGRGIHYRRSFSLYSGDWW